ncbi:MAG: hypothetical protein ABI211_02565 [Vicinamibacterales bacterium]
MERIVANLVAGTKVQVRLPGGSDSAPMNLFVDRARRVTGSFVCGRPPEV